MRMSRIAAPLIAIVVAQLLPLAADAQFGGFYTLPKDDFIWNWGDVAEGQQRGMADIEISGTESFFRCDLTVRLSPASSRSPSDVREMEMELRQRLDFIYAASEAMNYLEYSRELSMGEARLQAAGRGQQQPGGACRARDCCTRQDAARARASARAPARRRLKAAP